jgi:hypothetical protein
MISKKSEISKNKCRSWNMYLPKNIPYTDARLKYLEVTGFFQVTETMNFFGISIYRNLVNPNKIGLI